MDRCALFVDASYVLADGAMAVHGTRRGESVSWDYEGLFHLLSSVARERTGLPLLRCYWYEATVDGRRTAEQDALADIPGIKLRVAKIRPGRREGVDTEIHRDLTTLARNNAISDALVISAEEDLAQVIADVQDLGMRVTLVHLAVDGNWTISRALRQESDDIIEIGAEQLRPYVELIVGAEPPPSDEADDADLLEHTPGRKLANGHSVAGGSYQPLPAGSVGHAPPVIYTAPVVAEYQRPAAQLPWSGTREDRTREDRAREDRPREDRAREDRAREDRPREDRPRESINGEAQPSRPEGYAAPAPPVRATAGPAGAGRVLPAAQRRCHRLRRAAERRRGPARGARGAQPGDSAPRRPAPPAAHPPGQPAADSPRRSGRTGAAIRPAQPVPRAGLDPHRPLHRAAAGRHRAAARLSAGGIRGLTY